MSFAPHPPPSPVSEFRTASPASYICAKAKTLEHSFTLPIHRTYSSLRHAFPNGRGHRLCWWIRFSPYCVLPSFLGVRQVLISIVAGGPSHQQGIVHTPHCTHPLSGLPAFPGSCPSQSGGGAGGGGVSMRGEAVYGRPGCNCNTMLALHRSCQRWGLKHLRLSHNQGRRHGTSAQEPQTSTGSRPSPEQRSVLPLLGGPKHERTSGARPCATV